jgi:hypothetical protein
LPQGSVAAGSVFPVYQPNKNSTLVKTPYSILLFSGSWLLTASARADSHAAAISSLTGSAPDTPYVVAERGANYRVWQRVTLEQNPLGRTVAWTNSYVELATGLHYQENGQWKETQEKIEVFKGGAVARKGPHKVIFAPNLATVGAIDVETPDGKRLRSHVLGLAYCDTASGKSVLIAQVKDCVGKVSGNQVIYEDAFTDFKADVRYTYRKSGFEQDVILRERPPLPEAYGLSSQTTKLQVWTEFLNPPEPVIKAVKARARDDREMQDQDLNFGEMRLGRGRALTVRAGKGQEVPMVKEWLSVEGDTGGDGGSESIACVAADEPQTGGRLGAAHCVEQAPVAGGKSGQDRQGADENRARAIAGQGAGAGLCLAQHRLLGRRLYVCSGDDLPGHRSIQRGGHADAGRRRGDQICGEHYVRGNRSL